MIHITALTPLCFPSKPNNPVLFREQRDIMIRLEQYFKIFKVILRFFIDKSKIDIYNVIR